MNWLKQAQGQLGAPFDISHIKSRLEEMGDPTMIKLFEHALEDNNFRELWYLSLVAKGDWQALEHFTPRHKVLQEKI